MDLPSDGSIQDSITLDRNLKRLVCMSSSHIACLSAIGCDSLICGVSGIKYISDTLIQRRFAEGKVADVGSDVAADYERILSMSPDLVTAYSLPGSDFVKSSARWVSMFWCSMIIWRTIRSAGLRI